MVKKNYIMLMILFISIFISGCSPDNITKNLDEKPLNNSPIAEKETMYEKEFNPKENSKINNKKTNLKNTSNLSDRQIPRNGMRPNINQENTVKKDLSNLDIKKEISSDENNIEFAVVPTDGKISEFKIATTETTYQQYVDFLNSAYNDEFITYDESTQNVLDSNGNIMTNLGGSRVVKDHEKDGEYELLDMENPLNMNFIEFNEETQTFYIEDPKNVNWEKYFNSELYPNVVDSFEDWREISGNKNGRYANEDDYNGLMPTIEEIKTWPANFIQYYGAKAFADYYGYDLPTVDQWKLAAKGGADFEYATSDGTTNKGVAWINEDGPGFPPYPGHIQPAKSNEPNPLGIYNMGGNVWEWCEDWYRGTETFSMDKVYENYYISEEPENPEHLKALLGGSFNYFSATMSVDWVHAAKTGAGNDHFGFRVVKNNYILNELEENLETVEVEGLNLDDNCGHNIDPTIVNYGYNLVIDNNGNEVKPQGRPFQEGYQLIESETYIDDYNTREYAQIFAYIGNIRDALMCDIDALSENEWMVLTEVLELNNIKTTQSLTGTPKEQYYSSNGIYEHLTTNGEDFHPMMKYLEEAELELKCLAFKDFNFVNPKGENHCQIHNLDEGSGLILPE